MNCFDKSPFGIHSETLSYICVHLKLNSKQLWVLHLTQGAFNIIGNVESPNVECPLYYNHVECLWTLHLRNQDLPCLLHDRHEDQPPAVPRLHISPTAVSGNDDKNIGSLNFFTIKWFSLNQYLHQKVQMILYIWRKHQHHMNFSEQAISDISQWKHHTLELWNVALF